MDAVQIAFVTSDLGTRALAAAALLPPDRLTRLTRLRRDYTVAQAAALVELLELRLRARAKFADAERMFFTREGLEQATGEVISGYRARSFPPGTPVLDACCGIGGDALALRQYAPVLAADSSPAAAACALANARVVSPNNDFLLHTLCADVTTLDLRRLQDRGFGAAFFDPSRRLDTRAGRSRARNAEDYLPPLSWLSELTTYFAFVGVKVSPAIDDDTLAEWTQRGGRVEFIAEGSECKEAVLWFGAAAERFQPDSGLPSPDAYSATVLNRNATPATLLPRSTDAPAPAPPRAWLYEPNPAVIRAHRVTQLAALLYAAPIDSQIAYLTADEGLPTPFATVYRILDWMPFHIKNLQAWLRTHRRRVEVVKRRGVLLEPIEIRKKLASPALADHPPVILVLTRRHDQTLALFCDSPQPQPT